MIKLLTATILVAGLATSAFAQTDNAPTNGGAKWDEMTNKAFFNDDMSMRSDADVRTGYMGLTADQQNMVKSDCAKTGENVGAGNGSGAASGDGIQMENLTRVCDMVKTM